VPVLRAVRQAICLYIAAAISVSDQRHVFELAAEVQCKDSMCGFVVSNKRF
jgi:hypothetical protein